MDVKTIVKHPKMLVMVMIEKLRLDSAIYVFLTTRLTPKDFVNQSVEAIQLCYPLQKNVMELISDVSFVKFKKDTHVFLNQLFLNAIQSAETEFSYLLKNVTMETQRITTDVHHHALENLVSDVSITDVSLLVETEFLQETSNVTMESLMERAARMIVQE